MSSLAAQSVRAAISLAVLAISISSWPLSVAQGTNVDEYSAKASFLTAFPNFIDWPASAFPTGQAPLILCVFGDFSFGSVLAEKTRGVLTRGRRIEVRWARKEFDLRGCNILFVSRSESKQYARILKFVQATSVLTVGETPDFLASGGVINFFMEKDKLQFEVSMNAANDAHLRISAGMLALARHVAMEMEKGSLTSAR